jgi:hypothetical protein
MSSRDEAREILRELLHEALGGNGNGHQGGPAPADSAPRVPAPPVAAVFRPSTWQRPPAPGEVIGDGTAPPAPAPPPTPAAPALTPSRPGVELVVLDSDADLDRFVRSLLARFESPRERSAIKAGRLRFALRRGQVADGDARARMRIERGAVTERTIKEAAAAGARVILAPAAVLTPLARERARALGVEIEREKPC